MPMPKVIASSVETDTNTVDAEFMIMDVMPGALGYIAREVCKLDFGAFGSLYLNTKNRPLGALAIGDKYCIGPHCGPQYWTSGGVRSEQGTGAKEPRGRWQDLTTYFSDLADDHKSLLDISAKTCKSITKVPTIQAASKPTLFHPTSILGLIDWQTTAIEPAFVHCVETQDFAEELQFDELFDPEPSQESLEMQQEARNCGYAWAVMSYVCAKLKPGFDLDPSVLKLLAAGSSGWLKDEVVLRSILAHLDRKWAELDTPGKSLYHSSELETKALAEAEDERVTSRRLRTHLARLLDCGTDGWVEGSNWEETLVKYRAEWNRFRDSCVENREEHESEEDAVAAAERLWPWDITERPTWNETNFGFAHRQSAVASPVSRNSMSSQGAYCERVVAPRR
ncbi:uncharacterized protein LTR77_007439 [Saxophila tyrrhenica]|uniref:Uncharacterized protein n=1 Tax=Saxophila tyrrhenica TaxID=1690608 RepID=A0AAV9P8T3_9PEZI|nr:hypothetical protein LTR77_007439 [Saxophila tyrrhenica]